MPASDWSELCPLTACWQPFVVRDQYGKSTYGSIQTFAPPTGARRVYKKARVASQANGQAVDVLSESQIWLLATPAIGPEDKVYILGDTEFPPILSIQKFPDENGDVFLKIFFGSFKG